MNLPEEFVLLAYRDDGTPLTDGMHLDNGLGGALLLELALAEKVDVVDKKVVVLDAVESVAESEARQRMVAAVSGSGAVEPRTAALCALVAATDLDKKIFADLDRSRVKARLKEIGEGAWAATAVKKSIEEIQAAIMIAVMVSTTTAATAGS